MTEHFDASWLACCGAFLTIFVLAINPFVQQIVKSGTRTTIYSNAPIPITSTFNTHFCTYNPVPNKVDELNVKAAVMAGLLTAGDLSFPIKLMYNLFALPGIALGRCIKILLSGVPAPI